MSGFVKKHCKTPSENGPAVDCIRIGARAMPTLDSGRVCKVRASDGPSPPTAVLSAILLAPPHLYATARRLAQPLLPSFLPHLPGTICTGLTFFCEPGTWARFNLFLWAQFSLWCGSVQ
ncbi:hypothetical protein VPH35_010777 [Triticum aestivum]